MSNMTGRFLTQKQMAEAKSFEAICNSIQKRAGTRHPLSNVIAWDCGCIGPVILRNRIIPTSEQADAMLKLRKHKDVDLDELAKILGCSPHAILYRLGLVPE